MHSFKEALTSEMKISKLVCWTDSKVAWYWITQSAKEWKQFVQHRVDEIKKLVPAECWKHCPGTDNPADLPFRGMDRGMRMEWKHVADQFCGIRNCKRVKGNQ